MWLHNVTCRCRLLHQHSVSLDCEVTFKQTLVSLVMSLMFSWCWGRPLNLVLTLYPTEVVFGFGTGINTARSTRSGCRCSDFFWQSCCLLFPSQSRQSEQKADKDLPGNRKVNWKLFMLRYWSCSAVIGQQRGKWAGLNEGQLQISL